MDDILLLTINAKWIHPSLALRLLKANLGGFEDRCRIIELNLRQSRDEQLAILAGADPAILGISVSIWNHKATLELLQAFFTVQSKKNSRPFIVLGGPEVSFLPENAAIFGYADLVIRGEGEKIFADLCGRILGGKAAPGPCSNAEPADLSAVKSAYHLYTREDLAHKLIYVESSRGCPFHCAFCQSGAGAADKIREFPLESFLKDMDGLLTRLTAARGNGAGRTIKFLDRSFNVNIPRALAIMEFFLSRLDVPAQTGAGFQVHVEMVPLLFPPDLMAALERFPPGSLRLETGIQSLNPQVCAVINRPSNPQQELENLRLLRMRTNAVIHADLIAGLPGEDLGSFAKGFDRLWTALSAAPTGDASAPFEIQPGILKGLPGTPIRALAADYGLRFAPDPPYEVIETAALSAAELGRLRNFARFWELIVNRPAFSDALSRITPPGRPVFWRFMELSDTLYAHFGRNWGIDRKELREQLSAEPQVRL